MGTKKLVEAIKTKHVNYEVLAAAVLHLTEEEQVKVNKLIVEIIGLPLTASAVEIEQEREKRVDAVDAYDVILDVFSMLKRTTAVLEGKAKFDAELVADARMIIGSIEDEK